MNPKLGLNFEQENMCANKVWRTDIVLRELPESEKPK
jgi:hypothetical protein